jgi:hypothetical protein
MAGQGFRWRAGSGGRRDPLAGRRGLAKGSSSTGLLLSPGLLLAGLQDLCF